LGVVGLVLALFIPFAVLVLRIFEPLVAAVLLGILVPLIGLVIGIIGFVKSTKQETSLAKIAKILSLIAMIIAFAWLVFMMYIFIKGGNVSTI